MIHYYFINVFYHFITLISIIIRMPRHLIARIAKEVDTYGIQLTKRRRLTRRRYLGYGPNFSWHADGKKCFSLSVFLCELPICHRLPIVLFAATSFLFAATFF